jgi:hypothetical protein
VTNRTPGASVLCQHMIYKDTETVAHSAPCVTTNIAGSSCVVMQLELQVLLSRTTTE